MQESQVVTEALADQQLDVDYRLVSEEGINTFNEILETLTTLNVEIAVATIERIVKQESDLLAATINLTWIDSRTLKVTEESITIDNISDFDIEVSEQTKQYEAANGGYVDKGYFRKVAIEQAIFKRRKRNERDPAEQS